MRQYTRRTRQASSLNSRSVGPTRRKARQRSSPAPINGAPCYHLHRRDAANGTQVDSVGGCSVMASDSWAARTRLCGGNHPSRHRYINDGDTRGSLTTSINLSTLSRTGDKSHHRRQPCPTTAHVTHETRRVLTRRHHRVYQTASR